MPVVPRLEPAEEKEPEQSDGALAATHSSRERPEGENGEERESHLHFELVAVGLGQDIDVEPHGGQNDGCHGDRQKQRKTHNEGEPEPLARGAQKRQGDKAQAQVLEVLRGDSV